ncbi:MAG: twin-arginine translocase TatA/TatE family subunit [Chthonomonas sp.]|nr:twin-arginine translocase TatA/TatE family subunit [Chthonomonas sp.]
MTIFLSSSLALFGGGSEWLIVGLVVLLLFGGSKIPQLMRGIGQGAGEFQRGIREGRKPEDEKKES